jgi:hypothetical protein
VRDGAPDAAPVSFRHGTDAWLVRLPGGLDLPDGTEVVVLIDDGRYYFELRGLRARGTLGPTRPDGWRPFAPGRIVTWDYGTLREQGDE